jgi:intein-encoded DNA endonuclease-like protein
MAQGPGFYPEGEGVKRMDNTTKRKRREIAPRHLRVKAYRDALKLRKRGLTQIEISNEIHRRYGIWIDRSTIGRWVRGESSPYNGRRIPSLELLKPSEDLAYVIGVRLGDGYAYKKGDDHGIGLQAKDKEFVEEFGICLCNVLGRELVRPQKYAGTYIIRVTSKTLYELLRKPVDLKRIKPYVEHCPKCAAAFLRGLFDSEGCVSKKGYITLHNSDYEILVYAQRLLWRYFGIKSTGPWPGVRCYHIYIRAESLPKFYNLVGFTIKRKRKRLEEYLRRVGKL